METSCLLHKYLQQQVLHIELQELLRSSNGCLEACGNDLLYDLALQRNGYAAGQTVLAAVQLHMSVEGLSVRAEVAEAALSKTIAKRHLLETNLPKSWKTEASKALLPDLDQQLSQRIEWLSDLLEFKGHKDELPDHIKQLDADVKQAEEVVQALQHAIDTSAAQLVDGLRSCLDLLIFLLHDFKLDQHLGHARARGSYLRSHCQTLIAKVALFEQRLLADSYTSSSVPALDTLAQELTGAIEEAERNSQQATARLEAYHMLGPDMSWLAAAHHELDAELHHAEFTLREFQRVTHEDE
ncbi:hypothetical protein WJX84_011583 [Apatococcus fuscideae]|uniref:HAUS augmin-like complex subunit 4 n=1 Tax=Apatococcus fuscideae TaxID=2026836 RepID=A0AAW1TCR1_9CHLO